MGRPKKVQKKVLPKKEVQEIEKPLEAHNLESSKSIDQIIAESKATLDQPTKPLKRGRPKGSTNKPQQAAQAPQAPVAPVASPFLPILKQVVQMPYQVAAARTGFERWKLEDAEAEMISQPLDAWLSPMLQTIGTTESKWLGLGMVALSVAIVTFPRYIEFEEFQRAKLDAHKEKQKAQEKAPEVFPKDTQEAVMQNPVSAFTWSQERRNS